VKTGNTRNANVFGLTLIALLFALCPFAEAQQQGKVPRIGFLGLSSPSSDSIRIEAFRQGLRELGYVEGKSIIIEYRYAEGRLDRLPKLASELVRLNVDIIVARAAPAVTAAKNATNTTPIIMASVADAVRTGFVQSLAHPGGNITGLTSIMPELAGKRLELLKEIFPKLARVAFLGYAGGRAQQLYVKEAQDASQPLGIEIQPVVAKHPSDFKEVFSAMKKKQAGALVVQPVFIGGLGYGQQIAELAIVNRLPTVSDLSRFPNEGGLMSYGPDLIDHTRHAAHYVDKILKGTKPADLPVQQPTKFELVINLKTAKQIGVTIPPEVLARGNRVIR
jgi:putative ABC transport system substrate-binding protein